MDMQAGQAQAARDEGVNGTHWGHEAYDEDGPTIVPGTHTEALCCCGRYCGPGSCMPWGRFGARFLWQLISSSNFFS